MEIITKYNYLMTEIGLEIGSRNVPFINLVKKDLLPKNRKFIFIDKRHYWLVNLHSMSGGRKEGVTSFGQKLPFKENSVSMIFAKDLFGAHGYLASEPGGTYTIEDIGEGFASEWFRVCKYGGKVIIMEISTPPDKENLKDDFIKQGFLLKEELEGGEALRILKRGEDLIDKVPISEDSFSLIFEKPKQF